MRVSKKHCYDKLGICLKCDLCENPICCWQPEECEGTNWDFMHDGTIERLANEIKERRKNE